MLFRSSSSTLTIAELLNVIPPSVKLSPPIPVSPPAVRPSPGSGATSQLTDSLSDSQEWTPERPAPLHRQAPQPARARRQELRCPALGVSLVLDRREGRELMSEVAARLVRRSSSLTRTRGSRTRYSPRTTDTTTTPALRSSPSPDSDQARLTNLAPRSRQLNIVRPSFHPSRLTHPNSHSTVSHALLPRLSPLSSLPPSGLKGTTAGVTQIGRAHV